MKNRNNLKKILFFLNKTIVSSGRLTALFVLIALVWLRVEDPELLKLIRAKTFDFYQQMKPRSTQEETSPVVILDIDEKSLEQIGQWPWRRTIMAEIVDKLHKAQSAAVGFDFVMPEKDGTSLPELSKSLKDLPEELRKSMSAQPSNDQVLADSIKKHGRIIVGQAPFTGKKEYTGKKLRSSFAVRGGDPIEWTEKNKTIIRNIPEIEEAAKGRGVFSVSQERVDGIVRRVSLVLSSENQLFPSLSLETLKVAYGARSIVMLVNPETGIDKIALQIIRPKRQNITVPTDKRGRIWVYFKPNSEFKKQYISAVDLLEDKVNPRKLNGKIILIGSSAEGIKDLRSTPLDRVLPGVEVHANLLENILLGQQLTRPAEAVGAELLAAIALGLLMIIFAPMLGAQITLLLFVSISGGLLFYSWTAFAERLELYDAGYPMLVALIIYVFLTYTSYAKEEKERKEVRSAFGQYISPDLVKKLENDPTQLSLGGEMRDMTFMFSDIRGFTSISELFDAEGLTNLINRFLTPITNVILNNKGTIDKYMGDCVMAFWNAPLADKDHAVGACISALEMIKELEALNNKLEKEANEQNREHRPIRIGIGINSGEACVGNMGSDQRFDYSVLGDSVNLASRLEGQSKTYGMTCLLGEDTAKLASEFACLELDLIQVKGKTEAVKVFGLLGNRDVSNESRFIDIKKHHEEMIRLYRNQQWDKAEEELIIAKKLLEKSTKNLIHELNGVYELYRGRIEIYKKNPPNIDWNGVFIATSK